MCSVYSLNSVYYQDENFDEAYTYQEFLEILKNYEIQTASKFVVHKSPKGFLVDKRELTADLQLHWKGGLPFFHFGTRVYACHQGKDYNVGNKVKHRQQREQLAKSNNVFPKWNKLTQGTKKVDCPVVIKVTRAYIMPDLQLEHTTVSKKRTLRDKIISNVMDKEALNGREIFWFSLPPAEAHKNHTSANEPLDPIVRMKIKEYVQEGKTKTSVISELLKVFAATELQQFDQTRRRFYPEIHTIKAVIKEARQELRLRLFHSINSSIQSIESSSQQTSFEQDSSIESTSQHTSFEQDYFIQSIEVISEETSIKQDPSMQSIESVTNQTSFEQDSFIQSIEVTTEETPFQQNSSIQTIEPTSNQTSVKNSLSVSYSELKKKDSSRKKLINVCREHLSNLKSMFHILPEAALVNLEGDLAEVDESYTSVVNNDCLPSTLKQFFIKNE